MKNGWLFACRYMLCALLLCAVTVGMAPWLATLSDTDSISVEGTPLPVIVLDAGHGGEDCGAVGVDGVYEKDLNLKIAFLLRDLFLEAGYRVVMTRTEDRLLYTEEQNIKGQRKAYDLRNRLLVSEDLSDAWLISIHMNQFPEASCRGLQVWHNGVEPARELALSVQNTVRAELEPHNRRKIKQAGTDMYLLHRSTHPAILIECGFLSNSEDCTKLGSEDYQKELSFAIFCAMIQYNESKT